MATINYNKQVALSTDHPLSSYGIPVAIIDGQPCNPGDLIKPSGEFAAMFGAQTVAHIVSHSYCPSYVPGTATPATEKDAMYHKYMQSCGHLV